METKEKLKKSVWEKGLKVSGFDPKKIRKDACGAWIAWDKYEDLRSPFGWQIDHIYPEARLKLRHLDKKLIDKIDNLRPFHWRNNEIKGTDYPIYCSAIKANGNHNEEVNDTYEVNKDVQLSLKQLYEL